MPAPPDDARSLQAHVVSVEPCGADAVLLTVLPTEPIASLRASRFFMLRREDSLSPAIPRPFSIYRQRGDTLQFLIKVMGTGTRALAESRPGDVLRVIGPLGNGWPTLDGAGDPWVMLAGGVGSAPFIMGIEQAIAGMDGAAPVPAESITLLFGAATQGLLYDLAAFEALGVTVATATDDGSHGRKGNVLDLLRELWDRGTVPQRVRLLACGPDPMLHAVSNLAREHDLECWLSLETLMGCGVGICNGCPIAARPEGRFGDWGNAKCCVEGPVFSTRDIDLAAFV